MKPQRAKASKAVTWIAACTAVTGAFEGCDLTAKVDTIGTGHPLTWCHGETIGDAKPGERFTKAQCDAMLEARLPSYWAQIKPCIHVETSDNEKIAYTSAAYNIGPAAFCRSAIVRDLNAGNHPAACGALMLYTHARGKFVQGLYNRRDQERKICLTPDPAPTPVIPAAPPAKVWAHWYSKFLSWSWWAEA
jgi:lysozyme